jgi:hypothetical protein
MLQQQGKIQLGLSEVEPVMGLEPIASRLQIWRSAKLSYTGLIFNAFLNVFAFDITQSRIRLASGV